jgi:2-polyprenyl-3-methyl-5-hydroxy-6-metoxy-1,4-benzoquinol methylase
MSKMNKSEKFWDKFSKNYDTQAKSDKSYHRTIEIINKYTHPNSSILDFACATGLFSMELAAKANVIHGLDISPKMIEAANRKAAERGLKNTEYVKASIFDDRYTPESYDMVLALNILLFFQDTGKVIARIYHLLKPGGVLISATACLAERKTVISHISAAIIYLLMKAGILPKVRFFRTNELENMITEKNFKISETEILMHSPANEYVIIGKKG